MQYLPSGHLERDDSVVDSLLNSTPVYRLRSILRMNLDSATGSVVQVLCQDIPRQDIFSKDISSLILYGFDEIYTVSMKPVLYNKNPTPIICILTTRLGILSCLFIYPKYLLYTLTKRAQWQVDS